MGEAVRTVEELVQLIERGELRLPEMQRDFVWTGTRVRDLCDSLYRGYPSGTVLVWETDEVVPQRDFAVSQEQNAYITTKLLLDGQQRLTSLSAITRGKPVSVRGKDRPIELLFNLEHPEDLQVVTEVEENNDDDADADGADTTEDDLQQRLNKLTFVVATKKLEQLSHWVRVSEVFMENGDAPFLAKAGIERIDDPRYKKYSQRLARLRDIRNYRYRMDVLERRMSYDEVTEIFVRVNSLGAKLRSSDLALAQITAKWRNSLRIFQKFQEDCAKSGFFLDLGIHLRNMIVFATGQSRFRTVGGLSKRHLEQSWAAGCDAMEFAINFLKNNARVESPVLLSSPYLLIVLAYFAYKRDYRIDPDVAERLRYWALVANAKGRYSRGSSETILDQDLASIVGGSGPEALVDRLRLQVGRLQITADELKGRNQRSSLFKTMFLAFRAAGAKDWVSHLAIALDHSGAQHRLQFHHIFPKAALRTVHVTREADDIANLAFIGGKTNRSISDKAPSTYLPALIEKVGQAPFDAQCIPTDHALLGLQSYNQFLIARRDRIADRLNEFLGHAEPALT
jgi:hypothetical protein